MMAMKLYPYVLKSSEAGGDFGAAVLVFDSASEADDMRGFFAAFGDDEWEEDLDTVLALQAQQYPGAYAFPVTSMPTGDLPVLPNGLNKLDVADN